MTSLAGPKNHAMSYFIKSKLSLSFGLFVVPSAAFLMCFAAMDLRSGLSWQPPVPLRRLGGVRRLQGACVNTRDELKETTGAKHVASHATD